LACDEREDQLRRSAVAVVAILATALLLATLHAAAATPRPATPLIVWAVVNVDGTLARGSGAVSSRQLGADGTYEVTFNRDITRCAHVATAGEAGTFPADDAITLGTSTSETTPNGVYLIEYDAILGRDSYSSGFHLIVTC
jgi:hypothetical protein